MKNMSDAAQLSATIACLKFVPDLQQVFVCERGSLAIKIYNQQMQLMAMLFVRMPAREGVSVHCGAVYGLCQDEMLCFCRLWAVDFRCQVQVEQNL